MIETVFAIGVLSVAALGMAGIFTQGMQKTASSPAELIATQKAAEAIESVFSARDSHSLPWSKLQNTNYGGIFKVGPQPMTEGGPDGVVGTNDDGPVESTQLPGVDQMLGTADDKTSTLAGFTRQIVIVDKSVDLREITVIITYKSGPTTRSYTLTALISTFA